MKTKHKPATPLPWTLHTPQRSQARIHGNGLKVVCMGDLLDRSNNDAAYIAHAANAYPKLVDALHLSMRLVRSELQAAGEDDVRGNPILSDKARKLESIARLLRELGEDV